SRLVPGPRTLCEGLGEGHRTVGGADHRLTGDPGLGHERRQCLVPAGAAYPLRMEVEDRRVAAGYGEDIGPDRFDLADDPAGVVHRGEGYAGDATGARRGGALPRCGRLAPRCGRLAGRPGRLTS